MNRISIREAAQRFGVSRRTVERWIRDGRLTSIPSLRDARRRLVDPVAVQCLVDEMSKRTTKRTVLGGDDERAPTNEDQFASERALATRYHQAIDAMLMRFYGQHQRLISRLHPDAHVELSLEELRKGPLGHDLGRLAAYALGRVHDPSNLVLAAVESVLQALFWPAAAEDITIPRSFWDTDLGKMLNRAKLRAYRPNDLISVDDAAKLFGVTTPTVYRWMDDRTLGWVRDDVNGRTWVVRRDADNLKRVATELAARQVLMERALAS